MDWKLHIHSDPNILLGKPVIKGTRLSVEFILGLFAEGWTEQQILESYPTLNAIAPLNRIINSQKINSDHPLENKTP
jgi:uncharacterized protein (DUF433 family)